MLVTRDQAAASKLADARSGSGRRSSISKSTSPSARHRPPEGVVPSTAASSPPGPVSTVGSGVRSQHDPLDRHPQVALNLLHKLRVAEKRLRRHDGAGMDRGTGTPLRASRRLKLVLPFGRRSRSPVAVPPKDAPGQAARAGRCTSPRPLLRRKHHEACQFVRQPLQCGGWPPVDPSHARSAVCHEADGGLPGPGRRHVEPARHPAVEAARARS